MNFRTMIILIVSAFLVGTGGIAFADVDNQATQMTFDQPVRIPGQVLPPGTYWFKVTGTGNAADTNKVQVTNADGTKVLAQIETATADKMQLGKDATAGSSNWPSGKVILTVAEGANGEPLTLLTWFYPGRTDGHKFLYTDREQKQLDEDTHHTLTFKVGDKVKIGSSLASFD